MPEQPNLETRGGSSSLPYPWWAKLVIEAIRGTPAISASDISMSRTGSLLVRPPGDSCILLEIFRPRHERVRITDRGATLAGVRQIDSEMKDIIAEVGIGLSGTTLQTVPYIWDTGPAILRLLDCIDRVMALQCNQSHQ